MLQWRNVIRSFRHKGLAELLANGRSAKVFHAQQPKLFRLLHVLNAATSPWDMNLPGHRFHQLHGPECRYSVRVSGNWRLTFGWDKLDATQVDFEDYH
jgi:proteic killer suppression protein